MLKFERCTFFTITQSFSYFFEMIIPYIIKNSCNFATNKI